MTVIAQDLASPDQPGSLWCETSWTLGPGPGGVIRAHLDAEATRALARAAREQPPPVAAARAAGLSLSFGFIAAEALSSAREAAALEPGDVIAFPRAAPASTPGRQGWLSIETWRLAARFDDLPSGRSLTILSEETTMPEQESTLSGGAQLDRPAGGPVRPGSPDLPGNQGRLDRLPVRISVSLGKVSLTAAELLRLAPGAVIELREPLGGEVEVLAGGSPFAKGELVTVDGALGVRITTLLP